MYALGLHVEDKTVKVALIHKGKKGIEIDLLRSFPLEGLEGLTGLMPTEQNVKPLYLLASTLADKTYAVVTGLDASDVLLRETSLKLTRRSAILSALPFQVEALIPYSLEEILLLPFLHPRDKTTTDILLIATSRAQLEKHLTACEAVEIDPDWVTATPIALWRWAQFVFPEERSLLVCHSGTEKNTYAAISDGRLKGTQTGSKKDLNRILSFLGMKMGAEGPKPLIFSGDSALLPDGLAVPENFSELQAYAIPLGLALDYLSSDKQKLQFRQGPYLPPQEVKKRKTQVSLYASCCLLLAAVMGLSSHWFLSKRESALKEELASYHSSTARDVHTHMAEWKRSLASQARPFPYLLSVPKVSDVLAWLSTHPQLLLKKGIEIQKIHYSLVQYPKLQQPNAPYQGKVELEFTASTPTSAREFHDALLKGEGPVDAKQKISWSVHQNVYHTSFFLNHES